MSAEAMKALGAKKRKEANEWDPADITVVGIAGDVTIEGLKAKFPGDTKAHSLIEGLRDRRADTLPPDRFINGFSQGCPSPVLLTNIGTDAEGKTWVCASAGRQRVMAQRIYNKRFGTDFQVIGILKKFAPTAEGTLAARMMNDRSNLRVESSPMVRAWRALEYKEAGVPLGTIAELLELTSEQAVRDIIKLTDCSPAVQAAVDLGVDAGGVTQTIAVKLSKFPRAEQEAKLVATAGKKGSAAKAEVDSTDAAPRMQKKAHVERCLAEIRKIDPKGFKGQEESLSDSKFIMEYLLGNHAALARCPGFFRLAVENALLANVKVKKGEFSLATSANDSSVEKTDVDSIEIEESDIEEEAA